MQNQSSELRREIEQLEIKEEQKNALYKLVREIEKKHEKLIFQNLRSENDKTISINILKKTVEELTQQRELVDIKTNELKENYKILQDSYAELEQFMQIASHDLKGPLRRIGNYSQLLSKRFSEILNIEGKSYLDNIVESVKHLSGIITDLLEHNKLSRDSELERIDIQELLNTILIVAKDKLSYTGITIFMPIEKLEIYGHRQNIVQVFTELIENAVKYHSEFFPIISIDFQTDNHRNEWIFSFKDNGVGLDEIYQEKAFLPFQRINYLERNGSGIGLANCRKSILKHGGKIWYVKNPIQGTTFYFTIPFANKGLNLKNENLENKNVLQQKSIL